MKKTLLVLFIFAMVAALAVPQAVAQATGTVKGTCKDRDGKLITDGVVEYLSLDTGRKYEVKTDAKGTYFSLGIGPGKYNVVLKQNGQELFRFNNVPVGLGELTVDFDLQKELANSAATQAAQLTPEQKAAREKAAKENSNIKTLNEKLKVARDARAAKDFDTAIAAMNDATQLDSTKDLLWFELGQGYGGKGREIERTDRAGALDLFNKAIDAYEKATAIKQEAAYFDNLGFAYAHAGRLDDAAKAYNQAATLDPTKAGGYYYNLGAALTNSSRMDEALEQFKKAIAADPTKADAYYQMGIILIGKEKIGSDSKVIPAEGTAEAFNKYLELAPTGPNADAAKALLASIGASVDTSFSKKKAGKK